MGIFPSWALGCCAWGYTNSIQRLLPCLMTQTPPYLICLHTQPGRRSLKGCAGRGGTQHTAGTATLQVSEPARPLSHLPEVTLLTLQPRLRHLRARRCSQPLESLSQGQEGMPGSFPWPGLTAPHGLGSKVRLSQSSGFKELPQTLWKQHYKNV